MNRSLDDLFLASEFEATSRLLVRLDPQRLPPKVLDLRGRVGVPAEGDEPLDVGLDGDDIHLGDRLERRDIAGYQPSATDRHGLPATKERCAAFAAIRSKRSA